MITCGHCKQSHHRVGTVRACHNGDVAPCDWLVKRADYDETGERHDYVEDCGAAAVFDTRGSFECEAGHSHVAAEVRAAEGWDYASDEQEARLRASYGHESRLPSGHIYMPH